MKIFKAVLKQQQMMYNVALHFFKDTISSV